MTGKLRKILKLEAALPSDLFIPLRLQKTGLFILSTIHSPDSTSAVHEYYEFFPNNPAYGWDGNHRGDPLTPQVFAWYAEVELIDGSEVVLEGDVTLVR